MCDGVCIKENTKQRVRERKNVRKRGVRKNRIHTIGL